MITDDKVRTCRDDMCNEGISECDECQKKNLEDVKEQINADATTDLLASREEVRELKKNQAIMDNDHQIEMDGMDTANKASREEVKEYRKALEEIISYEPSVTDDDSYEIDLKYIAEEVLRRNK